MYLEFAKRSFQNNIVYRLDYVAGVLNAIVLIFVNIAIWKAINADNESIGGIQLQILATYIVLSFLLQLVYAMNEYVIEGKVRSGAIAMDLLKPINFRGYLFSYHLGTLVFRLLLQFVPACIVSAFVFQMLPVFSPEMLLYFIVSAILGYLVLYNLNFIVWLSTFWFYWSFSLVTIKDAAILILSGALIPIWFLPPWLVDTISLTPFGYIFSTPILIYLGMMPEDQIFLNLGRQLIWVVVLFGAGKLLWMLASRKLVIQGG
ncbi:ABC transporter permease [Paenibacillaceae bacterium WGS1546]|uniref:ABC transporter permease n=1 Tax=Cohnella sp. WGS1546 TaxID=3366810 RepID=UPI00372D27B8